MLHGSILQKSSNKGRKANLISTSLSCHPQPSSLSAAGDIYFCFYLSIFIYLVPLRPCHPQPLLAIFIYFRKLSGDKQISCHCTALPLHRPPKHISLERRQILAAHKYPFFSAIFLAAIVLAGVFLAAIF